MRGENLKIGYLARVIREACLAVQDNLESAVEFLPRPRQQGSLWWLTGPGLFRLKWSRLPPAATVIPTGARRSRAWRDLHCHPAPILQVS